jgi:hypothetical protein
LGPDIENQQAGGDGLLGPLLDLLPGAGDVFGAGADNAIVLQSVIAPHALVKVVGQHRVDAEDVYAIAPALVAENVLLVVNQYASFGHF